MNVLPIINTCFRCLIINQSFISQSLLYLTIK
nr:MAG TPA: hypothetical protein [Caudoviricetes sp.]